ncbi:MAG: hypothetical protein ABI970_06645, partial [Chloroflexota bacterium]
MANGKNMDIRLNLSNAFLNKENLTGKQSAFGNSFHPAIVTLPALAAHIAEGKAFTLHAFKRNRRIGTEWVSSQLLALDLDDCPLSAVEIAALPDISQNSWLVYPSPSSTPEKPKTRVVFVLPDAVTEPKRWQALQLGIMAHFAHLNPDKACKDLARLFYGSTQPGHIVLGNVASWAWVSGLCAPLAAADYEKTLIRQQENRQVVTSGTRAEKYAQAAFNKAIAELAGAGAGERNATLFKVAVQLQSMALGNWPGIDSATVRSAIQSVYGGWENTAKSEKTMENGFKAASAKPLELPADQSKPTKTNQKERRLSPVTLPTFTADLTVNLRYITELRPGAYRGKPTLAIKSATDTGKTELLKQLLAVLTASATVLIITHRVSLVKGIVKRLGIQDYQDFSELEGKDKQLVRSVAQIVTTIDSLHLQAGRIFDYVIIDEAGQGLRHLIDGGTLGDRTIDIYDMGKQIIADAKHVWFLDAGMNDHDREWLKAVRGDVYAIENTHGPTRVDTVLLDSQDAAIQEAVEQVGAGQGVVLIPCATQRAARYIHKLLGQRYPDKKGRLISARNSNTTDTKAFVGKIGNTSALPADLDWLIYTHSMGTGVNIQSPVAAVIGIFGQPLAPADCMQMMARGRDSAKRFAYAPGAAGGGETDAAALLSDELLAAEESSYFGTLPPDASTKGAARLEAVYRAQRNREFVAYADYFAAYSEADGSRVVLGKRDVPSALKIDLKLIAEYESAQIKAWALDTINIPAVDNDMLEKLRRTGSEITDTLIAGNLRHKIQDTVGLQINEEIYTRYRTAEQRRQFIRFCSLFDEQTALEEIDRQQGVNRLPLHRRKHYSAGRALFMGILKRAFDVDTVEALKDILADMPADELTARVGFIGQQHSKQIRAVLGWREAVGSQLDN